MTAVAHRPTARRRETPVELNPVGAGDGVIIVHVGGLPLELRGGDPVTFGGFPVSPKARIWDNLAAARRKQVPAHGTSSRYSYWGCRCDRCRTERRRTDKLRDVGLLRREIVPVVKARRQIQALNAVGFTCIAISTFTAGLASNGRGVSEGMVQEIAADRHGLGWGIRRRTAALIDAAYRQLSEAPDPTGPYVNRCRRAAARAGYVPPEAWTDETIGDPDSRPYAWNEGDPAVDWWTVRTTLEFIARNPLPVATAPPPRAPALWGPLSVADRRQVVRALLRNHMSINQIALNLGAGVASCRSFIMRRGAVITPDLWADLTTEGRMDLTRTMVGFTYRGKGITVDDMAARAGMTVGDMVAWLTGPAASAGWTPGEVTT